MRLPVALTALMLFNPAPAGSADQPKPGSLKARVEVSKAIADLLSLKDGKVVVKGGHEITLFRGFEVELKAVDVNLRAKPDQALALHFRLKLLEETSGRNALARPGHDGAFLPHSRFEYQLLVPGAREEQFGHFGRVVEGRSRCANAPTPADWEAARLDALSKLDGFLRGQVSGELPRLAREVLGEKPGWYLENPFPFAIKGKAELTGPGKERKQVAFRLPPGPQRVRIDDGPFVVRDLVLAPPEQKK